MDVPSNVRLFYSFIKCVSVHKIDAVKDLQQLCLKVFNPGQERRVDLLTNWLWEKFGLTSLANCLWLVVSTETEIYGAGHMPFDVNNGGAATLFES